MGTRAACAALPAALPRWRRCQQLRRRSATGLILEIDIGERLTGVVAHGEARSSRRGSTAAGSGERMAWSETSGLHAQSTTRGYLLYRCVHHSSQRCERRRAPPALGYTLPHCILSRALISLERMLRLLISTPAVNEPRHLLALLRGCFEIVDQASAARRATSWPPSDRACRSPR